MIEISIVAGEGRHWLGIAIAAHGPHNSWRSALSPKAIMCGCLALVIVAAAAVSWFVWGQDVSSRQIEDLIGSWGMWGVFGSICLMVVHSFVPFPAGTKLVTLPVWYNVKVMAHTVIPDQPAPDTGIMAWSRYLSELEKLPQDDEGLQLAIQGARDMIAELEWLEPEGLKKPS